MKRTREKNCRVEQIQGACVIYCGEKGDELIVTSDYQGLPDDIREQYKHCLRAKKIDFFQSFREEGEEEEDLESKYDTNYDPDFKPNKKMNKLEKMLENLKLDDDKQESSDFEFKYQRTYKEAELFKAEHDYPEILPNRTRSKKCVDNVDAILAIPDFENIRLALEKILLIKQVKFVKIIRDSRDSVVFSICNPSLSSQLFIVKYFKNTDETQVKQQYLMQRIFWEEGLAPHLMGLHAKDPAIMVTSKIDGTLYELFQEELTPMALHTIVENIILLFLRLCDANLSHRSLDLNHIGYIYNTTTEMENSLDKITKFNKRRMSFVLLDFLDARNDGCDPKIELVQMIRTTFPEMNLNANEIVMRNLHYICTHLIKLYAMNYDIDFNVMYDFQFWDDLYGQLFDQE